MVIKTVHSATENVIISQKRIPEQIAPLALTSVLFYPSPKKPFPLGWHMTNCSLDAPGLPPSLH